MADAMDTPMVVSAVEEASLRGAAIKALTWLGVDPSGLAYPATTRLTPRPSWTRALRDRWARVVVS
jgi:sugar (pentulose or hexulose) kinase